MNNRDICRHWADLVSEASKKVAALKAGLKTDEVLKAHEVPVIDEHLEAELRKMAALEARLRAMAALSRSVKVR
jgi:hypothetical protein